MAARKKAGLTVGQVLTLALAFLLASIMIFVLGIWVGRDLAEQKQRRDQPAVRQAVDPPAGTLAPREGSTPRSHRTVAGGPTPRPTRQRFRSTATRRRVAPTHTAKPRRRQPTLAPLQPTRRVAVTVKPSATRTVSRPRTRTRKPTKKVATPTVRQVRPTPSPPREARPPQNGALWSVQATATNDQVQALVMARGLREKGYEAFTAQAEVAGVTWYRVQVGKFSTKAEADAVAAKLRRQGMAAAIVDRLR